MQNEKQNMKKISVIIPVYNEEANVIDTYQQISGILKEFESKYSYEIIFTDNHSQDKTYYLLRELADRDNKVKIARFSKNFGYQKSIYTGYLLSTGDAAIQIDCDLQDPPEMIPEFIKKWEEGYKVVYGIRKGRKESWFMNTIRKLFYRLITSISEDYLPPDAGDFRLIDKIIVDELRKTYDYYPYIRGLIASFGFKQTGIIYQRRQRKKGSSKFNLIKLFDLALDGIVNHSVIPLRLATYFGLLIFIVSIILFLVHLAGRIFFSQYYPRGFSTIISVILFFMGINACFLGLIGEYIGRIYQQLKRRPITIIEETMNFDKINLNKYNQ